jgi:NTP pyrophosphatase (non-canonical NTP hydrolase)
MKAMTIFLPDSVAEHEGDIRYFVDSMVQKLAANSHKGWSTKHDVEERFQGIASESAELRQALDTENQFEAFMEAADVANMALLCGMAVIKQTRAEFDDAKPKTVETVSLENASVANAATAVTRPSTFPRSS